MPDRTLTDAELELMRARLSGKLVRILHNGQPYESRGAVGIVTAVNRPEGYHDSRWYAKVTLDRVNPWYLGSGSEEEWSVEVHEGGSRD